MQQLTAQDAQFLYMTDAHVSANITGIYIFDQSTAPDGKVRFKDILAKVQERLDGSPVFTRKLIRVPFEADYPYWVEDEHFALEYHVQHARLPAPHDWRQFCIHMARYHSRPMDMDRPLWEIYVVEGLDNMEGFPKGCFAIALKMHHAAVDGTSATQLLGSLMDLTPNGGPRAFPAAAPESMPEKAAPSTLEMMVRASFNNARSPMRMSQALLRASPQLYSMAMKATQNRMSGGKSGVPDTRFNGKVSPHKSLDGFTADLEDFKIIRKAVKNSKINDVVLAVCGGGVRKYLEMKGELPEESLVTTAPVNARASAGAEDGDLNQGNHITAMTVPVYTNIADPIERLQFVVRTTKNTKAGREGLEARLMTDLTKHVPAATQAMAARFVLRSQTMGAARLSNMFISNVPGPQVPLYFCGAEMLDGLGMAPISDGMGLFIATPSYNGKISFSVTSTLDIIPDMPEFIQCLKDSLTEMKEAAAERVSRGEIVEDAEPPQPEVSDAVNENKPAKKRTRKRKTAPRVISPAAE